MADEQLTSALAGHGLSMDLTAAATEAISKVDAMLVLRDGKVSVEARVPGEAAPRRLSLRSTPTRPANIGDLLRRSQFDRVVSAITSNELVYIDALPGGGIGEYAPADLVAIGAVAARQRVAEHVRKLEDTGLATYEGEDPVTFFATLLVIALYLTLLSAVIIHLCENPGQVEQPDWVCTAGAVLAAISLGLLALVVLGMFIEGVAIGLIAWIAFPAVLVLVIESAEYMASGFSVTTQPQ